jgi:hypothetical protein
VNNSNPGWRNDPAFPLSLHPAAPPKRALLSEGSQEFGVEFFFIDRLSTLTLLVVVARPNI